MHQIQSLLITGGTGSFGQAFVKTLLAEHPHIQRLVVYSRDELKQYEMAQVFSPADHPGLRYFIGDVRDHKRLHRALEGIDTVKCFFYANEGHPREPAHIHVRSAGIEAKFWLTPDVQLARNDGFDAPSLRRIERLVRQHRERFLSAWNEYFA